MGEDVCQLRPRLIVSDEFRARRIYVSALNWLTMNGPTTLYRHSQSSCSSGSLAGNGLSQSTAGIMPRAIVDLFRWSRESQLKDGTHVRVHASYLEIYNERMYDLLQPYKEHSQGGAKDPCDMQQKKAGLEVGWRGLGWGQAWIGPDLLVDLLTGWLIS